MAVVNVKSALVTNLDAVPPVMGTPYIQYGQARPFRGFAAVTAADSINSTYRFARLRSSDLLHWLEIAHIAFGAAATMDFGFYHTAARGGAIIGTGDQIATLVDMNVNRSQVPGDISYEALVLTNAEKRIWEVLGLTKDPMIDYDLVGTLKGAAITNTGTLLARGDCIAGA